MNVSSIGGSSSVYSSIGTSRGQVRVASTRAPAPSYTRPLGDLWSALESASTVLDAMLESPLALWRRGRLRPSIVSGTDLGLLHNAAASPLVSTEEVNTEASSFLNRGWKKGSTASIDVSGIYDGSNGNGRIEFEGPNQDEPLSEAQGVTFTVTITGDTPASYTQEIFANDPFEAMGMTFEFGAGLIDRKDSVAVDVSGTPGTVRPKKPFDGVGKNSAGLEQGYTVVDGAFALNGVTIGVFASDSIDSVVDRINASGAGVTADWNQGSEVLEIASEVGELIEVGNDTSGFLAAMKLDGAIFDQYDGAVLDDVSSLSIQSGFFTISGTTFTVDTSVDSVASVADRVNAAGVGVTADYDAATGKMNFSGTDEFSLTDGTSGLFTALGVDEGLYGGTSRLPGRAKVGSNEIGALRKRMSKLASSLDAMVKATQGIDADVHKGVLDLLRGAVSGAFEAVGDKHTHHTYRSSTGLSFLLSEHEERPSIEFEGSDLRDALSEHPEEVADFLWKDRNGQDDDGLLVQLRQAVERSRIKVRARALSQGPGSLVSTFA